MRATHSKNRNDFRMTHHSLPRFSWVLHGKLRQFYSKGQAAVTQHIDNSIIAKFHSEAKLLQNSSHSPGRYSCRVFTKNRRRHDVHTQKKLLCLKISSAIMVNYFGALVISALFHTFGIQCMLFCLMTKCLQCSRVFLVSY